MLLAGLRPETTPLGDWIDAEWAAVCELVGPGEHLVGFWEELTGESVAVTNGPSSDTGTTTEGRETAEAIRSLSDDERARMIPAYAKALDEGASDEELADLDAAFAHTAKYASGQRSLVENFPDASKKRGKRAAPAAPIDAPSGPAVGGGVSFEMPDDEDD